jgi:type I restriction enzyme, S subunit
MKIESPETWENTTLDTLIDFVIGGDWGKAADLVDGEYAEILCIRGSEFRNWDQDKGQTASLRKVKKSSLEKRMLREGDILVEISGGGPEQPVGRVVLIDKSVLSFKPNVPKLCTNFLRRVRPVPAISPEFLNTYLSFYYKSGEIVEYQAGSNNLRNLKLNDYTGINIPVPPLNEQKRIVAKIETLFGELEAAVASLKKAQAQLKTYRQALLKHAFEGKLTAAWRAAHADQLEDAHTLLHCIKAERQARYEAEVAAWEGNGRRGQKPRPPKNLPPLTPAELDELPQLPAGWAWAAMNEIWLESVLGKMLDKQKNKGQLKPYLRNINVRWGSFEIDDLLEMRFEPDEVARYGLRDGDFVICEGGEPGRCAVWRETYYPEIKIQKALHRVRFPERISPYFAQKYFELCASSKRLEEFFTGTTIKHLTGQGLAKLPIPICSFAEQHEILSLLDERLLIVDQLEQTITTALQQAESLRQSILKKAFSGQLVPQDPNDEPAAALLARIRAAKEGQ